MNKLQNRRREILPNTLRKHSDIVGTKTEPKVMFVGDRDPTSSGFRIKGYAGKFETFFETITPNAMTPIWQHEAKTRVYRVLSGSGYIQKTKEDGTLDVLPISAGDEVVCDAKVPYRVLSSSVKLELFVSQESKYEARLAELEASQTVTDITTDDLVSISVEQKLTSLGIASIRRSSDSTARARDAMAEQQARRTVRQMQQETRKGGADFDTFVRNPSAAGVNASPILNFPPE